MVVTFSCSAYADIMMFGDVAVRLLRLMGHSGTLPGAPPCKGCSGRTGAFASSNRDRTEIVWSR